MTKKSTKEEMFNVFDGVVIHKISLGNLAKFIAKSSSSVTVTKNTENPMKVKSRIKLSKVNTSFVEKSCKKLIAKKTSNKNRAIIAVSGKNKKKKFVNIAACSRCLHIDDSNISKVLKGKRKTAKGYRFEYA